MSDLYLKLDDAVNRVMLLSENYGELPVHTDDKCSIDWLTNELEQVCELPFMRGNDYQKLAARTINPDLYYSANIKSMTMHALHGMVGEIGEIHSLYQKVYQGHEFDYDHMKKELGDLLWFIAEYCTAMGWDLEEVMALNIEKLKARFPEGFEVDKSLHRAEWDV